MANNQDFMKIVVKDVVLQWPRLDQPYRYNAQDKRTEACAAGAANAGYSIAWDMPMDEAKALFGTLKAHYNDCRTRNAKLPDFGQIFGMKKDEEAKTVRFTAKKRAVSQSGEINKPPRVVGPDLANLEEKGIWSGSEGSVRVLAFPTTDPDGAGGISLLLDTVQVTKAEYGSDNLEDDFGPAQAKSLDNFDEPEPVASVKQAAKEPAPADAEF